MKCPWCKGTKYLHLKKYGRITCLNCKGSGEGSDAGEHTPISGTKKPWAAKNFRRKNENSNNR